ncbi:MAG: CopD family protein [Myxococcota bacterium]
MIEMLYPYLVVLHVLAAIVWVGGVFFIGAVAMPIAGGMGRAGREVLRAVARRFRPIGWAALVVLVATGSAFLYRWGATWETLFDLSFFEAPHARLLGYKLVFVGIMLVVSFVHDFIIGPRASQAEPNTEHAKSLRLAAALLGAFTGGLALAIAILAVFVARPFLA